MSPKTARALIIALLLSYGVFILTMIRTGNMLFGYIALGIMALYGVFAFAFWRCPSCKKHLGPIWVSFCHKCGANIFAEKTDL